MKIFACLTASILSFSLFCHAAPLQDRKIEPEALSELACTLGIPEGADLIEETQNRWLQVPGREKWELGELSADQRLYVLSWAQKNGIFSEWKPASMTYDKALVLGSSTHLMKKRLNYLAKLWTQGVRFDEIVWLTGDRPLDKRIDGLTDRCSNESEAAYILWNETELPEEMRSLPVSFVAVPMKNEGGVVKRPNTEDTIIAWLDVCEEPCTALFISDQPFCGYQYAVIKSNMPDAFSFDVAGEGVDPSSHPAAAAITLDCVARWIYQENLIMRGNYALHHGG